MENLFYHISQVLGITIIHSLWQGLIIYMVLSLVLQFFVDKPASVKYKIAFGALSLMLGCFAYTLYIEISNYASFSAIPYRAPALPVTDVRSIYKDQITVAPIDRYYFVIAGYLPYVTMLYLAGLIFNTLKMALAWNSIYRIRQNITEAGFQQQVNNLARKMGIGRFVKVAFSEFIDVPCITGFLKPLILLPFSISSYLTAEEIAAILLHELAHIRRNDYLLNLVQQAIGILLFFNPFARLINKVINTERENSCDDMVVRTTKSPLIYAQALLKLEQNKQQEWHLALAATGKQKYHLLNRIERIMKTKKTTINIRPALLALVLLTCSLSSIAWLNPKVENGKVSVNKVVVPMLNNLLSDTIKTKAKTTKPAKVATKAKPAMKKKMAYVDVDGMDDAKLEKLQAEAEMHAKALEQYYDGPEFKKLQEEMEKKGAEMEAYYNSPKMKQLQENMERKSVDFEKMNNTPEMKKMQMDAEAYGKKIEAYYNSPAFAKLQKRYEEEAELMGKAKPGSAEFKKHEENFKKLGAEFKDYTNNAAIKEQIEISKKMSARMHDYYNNPEFKKQQEEMKAYGDSIGKAFQGPMMKEQQEAMRNLSKAMRDYQNRPEIQHEKEELKKIEQEMRQYRATPEYRKKKIAEIESVRTSLDLDKREVREVVRKEIAEARDTEERQMKVRREASERKEMRERKEPLMKIRKDTSEVKERRKATERKERPVRISKDTSEIKERKEAPKGQEMAGAKTWTIKSSFQYKKLKPIDTTFQINADMHFKAKPVSAYTKPA
jgi:bla regulator protein BlaR1